MLAHRVIVCLDVRGDRVVKGHRFVDLREVGDPVSLALRYEAQGADEIVFLDISATPDERGALLDVARRTAEQLFVPLTIGGGIRTADDAARALRAGADKISINSASVLRPELLSECAARFGSQCVVASIDARRASEPDERCSDLPDERCSDLPDERRPSEPDDGDAATRPAPPSGWRVVTHGGRLATDRDAVAWARECVARGAGEILLTSIDRDGTRSGYDLLLTRAIADAVTVPVIASGGAGCPRDLSDAIRIGGAQAVLVAGILHDGLVTVRDLKRALAADAIAVRPAA